MTVIEAVKAMPSEKLAPLALAFVFALGYFIFLFISMFHAVPAETRDLVNNQGQTISSVIMLIVGYFFGSSSSSKTKDDTIKASLTAAEK
jgi:hypothetical protein